MIYQKNILIYLLIILTILSYPLGYYLNENAAGAGFYSGDLGHVWKNLQIYLNNETIKTITSSEIYSNRPPLLYLFHKYLNPLTNNIESFRFNNSFKSLLQNFKLLGIRRKLWINYLSNLNFLFLRLRKK